MHENAPEVFEEEAILHMDSIYRTARRLASNQTEAEDLVQETFMQAWQSFDKYEPGTNCRAWLYKILFNKFDHLRRKKRTYSRFSHDEEEFVYLNAAHSESVPEDLTDKEVIAALEKLPAHYRSVVLLADVQEFDYKEVAEILEIPIGTVMSRLSRARMLLRKSLARVAEEYGIETNKVKAGRVLSAA